MAETPSVAFVRDASFDDGSRLQPGVVFRKAWTFRNSGTAPWPTTAVLKHASGPRLGAAPFVPLPPLPPGEETTVMTRVVAPPEGTKVRSSYHLVDAKSGQCFRGNYLCWLEIDVVPHATLSAKFSRDVTVPDNTLVPAGRTVIKQWELSNDGDVTWAMCWAVCDDTSVFQCAPAELLNPCCPGSSVVVAAELTVPADAPAGTTLRASWTLNDPNGNAFGTPFWATVTVAPADGAAEERPADGATGMHRCPGGGMCGTVNICGYEAFRR